MLCLTPLSIIIYYHGGRIVTYKDILVPKGLRKSLKCKTDATIAYAKRAQAPDGNRAINGEPGKNTNLSYE